MTKLMKAMKAILIYGLAVFVLYHVMEFGFQQSEREDCLRYQSQLGQGFPIVVPEWCYDEGYLNR